MGDTKTVIVIVDWSAIRGYSDNLTGAENLFIQGQFDAWCRGNGIVGTDGLPTDDYRDSDITRLWEGFKAGWILYGAFVGGGGK